MQFLRRARVADIDEEHEPVELRFGQRIRALLLDRVLRREDEERFLQGEAVLARVDLLLLHRLEQRRLRLRRGAVDFIGEHDVREDRPFHELERAPARLIRLLQNLGAGDVARHQVWRELHAAEIQRHQIRERVNEQRFRQARHAHEERMAAGENARQELLDDRVLPDDDLPEFRADAPVEFAELINGDDVRFLRGVGVLGLHKGIAELRLSRVFSKYE